MRRFRLRIFSIVAIIAIVATIFSSCSPTSFTQTTIKTPKGTSVTAWKVTAERSKEELDEADAMVREYYPNAVIVRNATQYYNCHSYAWYNTSSSNHIWLDAPNQETFWNDGSYVYVTSGNHSSSATIPKSAAFSGYRVRYYNDDHSARVYSSTKFIAKWGYGPLVRHSPNDSPYNNSLVYYYKAS